LNSKDYSLYVKEFFEEFGLLCEASNVASDYKFDNDFKPEISNGESSHLKKVIDASINDVLSKLLPHFGTKSDVMARNYLTLAKYLGKLLLNQYAKNEAIVYLVPLLRECLLNPYNVDQIAKDFVVKLESGLSLNESFLITEDSEEKIKCSSCGFIFTKGVHENEECPSCGEQNKVEPNSANPFGSEQKKVQNLNMILRIFFDRIKSSQLISRDLKLKIKNAFENLARDPNLIFSRLNKGVSSNKTLGQKFTGFFGKQTDFEKRVAKQDKDILDKLISMKPEQGGLGMTRSFTVKDLQDKRVYEEFVKNYEKLPDGVKNQVKKLVDKMIKEGTKGLYKKTLWWRSKAAGGIMGATEVAVILIMLLKMLGGSAGQQAAQGVKSGLDAPPAVVQALDAEPNSSGPPSDDVNKTPLPKDKKDTNTDNDEFAGKSMGKIMNDYAIKNDYKYTEKEFKEFGQKIIKAKGGLQNVANDYDTYNLALWGVLEPAQAKELLKNRSSYDNNTIGVLHKITGEKLFFTDEEILKNAVYKTLSGGSDGKSDMKELGQRIIKIKGGLHKLSNKNDAENLAAYDGVLTPDQAKELLKYKGTYNYDDFAIERLEKIANSPEANKQPVKNNDGSSEASAPNAEQIKNNALEKLRKGELDAKGAMKAGANGAEIIAAKKARN
jgi:hypothetical protein